MHKKKKSYQAPLIETVLTEPFALNDTGSRPNTGIQDAKQRNRFSEEETGEEWPDGLWRLE